MTKESDLFWGLKQQDIVDCKYHFKIYSFLFVSIYSTLFLTTFSSLSFLSIFLLSSIFVSSPSLLVSLSFLLSLSFSLFVCLFSLFFVFFSILFVSAHINLSFAVGSKRTRGAKQPKEETVIPEQVHVPTISEGYGEATLGSISRLLRLLETLEDESLRITSSSTFLDIGSGFGKVVFHAKLFCKVQRSVGIEYLLYLF